MSRISDNNSYVLREMEKEWQKELKQAQKKKQALDAYVDGIEAKLVKIREQLGDQR